MSYVYSMIDECLCSNLSKERKEAEKESDREKEKKRKKNIYVKGRKYLADQVDY